MTDAKVENVTGALALALADDLVRAAQACVVEAGPTAAALALVGHEPGLPIERLRRALGLSHPGAVRLVDRLERAGLVSRFASDLDRRAVALALTPEGHCTERAILSARQGALSRALAALSEGERATFGALADKMLRALVRDEDHAYAVCRLCDAAVCAGCPVTAAVVDG